MSNISTPERRCVLTGDTRPKSDLLRFVLAPDGSLCPDLKQVLPGRGLYISAVRTTLENAISSGQLLKAAARHFKTSPKEIIIAADLAGRIDTLACEAVLGLLGLERKAGRVTLGADAVDKACASGQVALLLNAADGAGNSVKFRNLARAVGIPMLTSLTRDELSLAFGRENVVHAALAGRGAWRTIFLRAQFLQTYRGIDVSAEDNNADMAADDEGKRL